MNKKNIFFFVALGTSLIGTILATIGGIRGTIDATNVSLEDIVRTTAYMNAVISGVILILACVLAFVGTGYIFRRSLIAPIILAVAAILCFVSLMSFGILGIIAAILLLAAAVNAFLGGFGSFLLKE